MRGRARLVLVAEVDVDRLVGRRHRGRERLVRRLAASKVTKLRQMIQVADTDGPCLREPMLDPVPRRMLQVEGES